MSRSSRRTLFSRRNRRSSSRSSVVRPSRSPASTAASDPVAHGRLTQVELAADRGQRPLAPAHQGDDLGLELRRERPSLPPACPVPLHLLPHTDSLLVGSRPLLRCPPVRGKSIDPLVLPRRIAFGCRPPRRLSFAF